jgi:hypothetical protein
MRSSTIAKGRISVPSLLVAGQKQKHLDDFQTVALKLSQMRPLFVGRFCHFFINIKV